MKEFGKLRLGRWFIFDSSVYVKTGADCATLMSFNACDGSFMGPYEVREVSFSYDTCVQIINIKLL